MILRQFNPANNQGNMNCLRIKKKNRILFYLLRRFISLRAESFSMQAPETHNEICYNNLNEPWTLFRKVAPRIGK